MPDTIPPIDYPDGFEMRKHNGKGISYQGRQFRIPKAFRGRHLGITPTTPDGTYQVWYRHPMTCEGSPRTPVTHLPGLDTGEGETRAERAEGVTRGGRRQSPSPHPLPHRAGAPILPSSV
jgi:hypothetical protein